MAQLSEKQIEIAAVAASHNYRYIFAGGNGGGYSIAVWNFLNHEERIAFRKSPIKSNIENYIRANNIPYRGSAYAYKFQVPGLPEALYRYTQNVDGGAL